MGTRLSVFFTKLECAVLGVFCLFGVQSAFAANPLTTDFYSADAAALVHNDSLFIFAGHDEVVTLSHRAYSRAIFGKGAIEAAKYLAGKPAGMYDMSDVLA